MLIPVWSSRKRYTLLSIYTLWLLSAFVFYVWWFNFSHIGSFAGFVATTIVVSWPLVLFGYSFFFLVKMKRPDHGHQTPKNLRVAMIVTKAPSEPLEVVQETLLGSLSQVYPHDTWVADEDPTEEALAWYKKHKIKVSTRKGMDGYHRDTWPRRKKCKEGNLAYFYDTVGYKKYDVVVQLDADHVPQEGYLEHMLRPFSYPDVGYVAAPSICDSNEHLSWSARARMHAEAIFHGPIQSGSNDGWVPICIGSHYAVRTSALQEIGGIGPELAEDYSTTLLMNAAGWRGVWVYDADARGEGPHSFSSVIVQDYQWARSLTIIFLTLFPNVFSSLGFKQKLQFLLTQLWYPTGALVWLLSLALLSVTLLTGVAPVSVSFTEFLLFFLPPIFIATVTFLGAKYEGHMKPQHGSFLTWENILFELARWPWICIAVVNALYSLMTSRRYTYRVTSKGKTSQDHISLTFLYPYLFTAIVLVASVVFGVSDPQLLGYYVFAMVIAALYAVLVLLVIALHIMEVWKVHKRKLVKAHHSHVVLTSCIIISIIIVASVSYGKYKEYVIETVTVPVMRTFVPVVAKTVYEDIQHVVSEHETLWSISRQYYDTPLYWQHIALKNEIQKPYTISIGERLLIPHDPSI